ncbi:peptidoglycan-binding protein [Streptomyces sp. NBC_01762]|uniref:peptidoglycan-binding domain-containing protein n=1 Tax=Streptomyces sp. NBC_01762 TaxID=2975933 RepID=UPI002DDC7311|nr:peptidoglycan-binding protein [Streptomyces sp. NBC_01762]WSC48972.1 peptidoglycan-binding protein [Streptomyces sp. NBC_01762]
MSWHRKRIKLGACTVGALTAALLVVSTTPAAASGTYSGRAYIWGNGTVTYSDDWDDEGLLQTSVHSSSNATCLWQRILWADGELASTSDVDGVFGTQTYNATVAWQRDENNDWNAGLLADGGVGKQSFGWAAYRHLFQTGGSSAVGQTLYLKYSGTHNTFNLRRLPDGNYEFVDGDGSWRKAGYDYRTCS